MKKIYLFLATAFLSFTALQVQAVTTTDITAYQSAWTTADSIKTVLTGYDSTLENLKATATSDYGKFDAGKISILQAVGSTYLINSYSTSSTQSAVTAATTTLQSVKDLLHEYYYNSTQYYFAVSDNRDGWYRIKVATSAGNYKFLTYSAGNKFLTATDDETQIWYATRQTNVNARIALSVLSDLRTGIKHTMSGSGAFFELFASGSVAGSATYTMKSAGTGGPVISGIDASTGVISYTGSPAYPANRNFSYRLILERVTDLSTAPSLADGNYTLQFNGTAVAGTYAVVNNSISIDGSDYTITKYGDKYAIGNTAKYFKSAALDSELEYSLGMANAVPYPCFTFTPTSTATFINEADKIKVYAVDNKIVVLSENVSAAQIFNITGQKITEQQLQDGKTVISNLNKGMYLVKAGNEIVKVILK